MSDERANPASAEPRRLAVTVRGIVQGVGFRPFIYRLATSEGLTGWVLNEPDAVRIEVQGSGESLDRFVAAVREQSPPAARVEQLETREIPLSVFGQSKEFIIRDSRTSAARRPTVPADMATCVACLAEIRDSGERRHRYPFTNCTLCGPRWSIIAGLPYDRPRTSMREFPMCGACQREYEDVADRRFHAQPIACPRCGPGLRLLDGAGQELARDDAALVAAARAVCDGSTVAVKGLGGFQLVVDATNQDAVVRLRRRKRRPAKPLAVMMTDLQAIEATCLVSAVEREALCSAAAPIMLLRRDPNGSDADRIAESVAPENPFLGVMLPYTPLHHLLLTDVRRPVVCTSGNHAEEPMATTTQEALRRLGSIADLILTHNRPIVRPVDDSVAREEAGGVQLLRRARGYAPIPVQLSHPVPCVLAVGGHLKNTVALSVGRDVVVSPHIGDLDNTLSLDVHRRAVRDLVGFFQVKPELVACDLHPDYGSTRHAEQLAAEWGVPVVRVQHHYAHVLSAMAEWQLEGPVLGLSWDGTGYGLDATVWGGEAIRVDDRGWQRMATLRSFALPGGDRAAREPRRAALGLLYEVSGAASSDRARRWFSPAELAVLLGAMQQTGTFPRCTSMGRLFDAIAAISGLRDRVSFEGEAAMQLEHLADPREAGSYPLAVGEADPLVVDWGPMLVSVLAELDAGEPIALVAARFHNWLATVALRLAQHAGCPQVVLTGGCFQNRLLTERTRATLSQAGFHVYTQRLMPPGDGGIALGQILGAARRGKG